MKTENTLLFPHLFSSGFFSNAVGKPLKSGLQWKELWPPTESRQLKYIYHKLKANINSNINSINKKVVAIVSVVVDISKNNINNSPG